jgi:hypothetical protein
MLLPPVPKIAAPVGMTVLRSVRLSPPPGGKVPPPPPLPRPPGVQTGDAPGPGGTLSPGPRPPVSGPLDGPGVKIGVLHGVDGCPPPPPVVGPAGVPPPLGFVGTPVIGPVLG